MTISSAKGNVKRRFLPMPSNAVHFCTPMVDKELFEQRKEGPAFSFQQIKFCGFQQKLPSLVFSFIIVHGEKSHF